jgi:Flp pilus assembly protein TadB
VAANDPTLNLILEQYRTLRQDISGVKDDLKEDIASVRADLTKQMNGMQGELTSTCARSKRNQWSLRAAWIIFTAALGASWTLFLTWAKARMSGGS